MMSDSIARLTSNWWTFLVRAVFAFALAAFAFAMPGAMASSLVYIVAAFFIVWGLLSLVAGVSFTGVGHWWALILTGALQVALGLSMLVEPGVGPLALAYLVAIWAVSTGLMEVMSAVTLRNYVPNEFWWALLGTLTVALGFYIIFNPALGVFTLVYSIALYAVFAGIALVGVAFRIKNAGSGLAKALSTAS
ncbi:MAG TPA: DUF308 domain-containing protein [Candidatus Elarobacter sp.]|nr:DUF308 domain-containing protein [Candidatus Elarobacter sp.]